jgi:cyclohexa-1,5-dienecarbonyl-CoA hydratase
MSPLSLRFNADQSRAAFTIRHPPGNIVTADIIDALRTGLDSIASNPRLKLITLEGEGSDFSFGASIPEHAADQIGKVLPMMHRLIEDLLEAPAVTAAIVRGRCLGGGFELALACDLIFAADNAQLGLPEVKLGVFPPAAAALLPARVGMARATRAIVTGETRSAAEWQKVGLVELVAGPDYLETAVERWFLEHLAPNSAVALRYAAVAVRLGLLAHVRAVLPKLERLYLDDLMRTADAVEGIAAFIERRPPKWKDS